MSRAEPVRALVAASFATAAVLFGACAQGADHTAAADDLKHAQAKSAGSSDAGTHLRLPDASPNTSSLADAGALDTTHPASTSKCPHAPISDGELQNQASGPSVFGRVTGGKLGFYDAIGNSACGIKGVRICLLQTDTCTESDAAGQFVLADLPDDIDIELSFEKTGLASVLRLAHLQGSPINLSKTRMLQNSAVTTMLESIGRADDQGLGSLIAVPIAVGEGIGSVTIPEGVKIALTPGNEEPYYSRGALEPNGLSSDELDPSQEATREGGWAMFVGLQAGDYSVRFERDGALCSALIPGFGFGIDELGQVRIRVHDGFSTQSIAALCP